MIIIVAKSKLKNDRKENFKKIAQELITESRKEKGCISYNLYEDVNDENILTFIEEWEDEEAINLHNKSAHFTKIIPELAELREGKPEINLYRLVEYQV